MWGHYFCLNRFVHFLNISYSLATYFISVIAFSIACKGVASHHPSHPFEDLMKSLKPHPSKGESIGFTDLQISIHKFLKGALTFSKELSLKVKPQILKSHGISLSQSTWSWQVYPTPSVP